MTSKEEDMVRKRDGEREILGTKLRQLSFFGRAEENGGKEYNSTDDKS